jgi:hypothetical protein
MKIEVAEVLYRGVCADCAAKIENPTTQSD